MLERSSVPMMSVAMVNNTFKLWAMMRAMQQRRTLAKRGMQQSRNQLVTGLPRDVRNDRIFAARGHALVPAEARASTLAPRTEKCRYLMTTPTGWKVITEAGKVADRVPIQGRTNLR